MAHVHHSDVDRTEGHSAGATSGVLLAIIAILVLGAVAFAVLWTQPWDDSSTLNRDGPAPITNDGGVNDGQSGDPSQGGGNEGSGGSQPQPPAQ